MADFTFKDDEPPKEEFPTLEESNKAIDALEQA